ncbi:hypothetical protein [Microlunatus speluncae]|uniref:hypothetical protein n=1 Tax=Microlunatus speluncae TaxID=2594267 RepID=UPI001266095F|nr:hypothetical protein [Microlunatus speluncae]
MDDELGRLSVRELIMRLADTEDTIRRTATFCRDRDEADRQPVNGTLIELARAEQRIIRELRQREYRVIPDAWRTAHPLAG